MRRLVFGAILTILTASPLFAQSQRAYVLGAGGFAVTPDVTSGSFLGEAGVRLAPGLSVFGGLGRFNNLQPSEIQPSIDSTVASLSSNDGLIVTGSSHVPAAYGLGGVRFEVPERGAISPYVLAGAGAAHVTPHAHFDYSSGTIGDSVPVEGQDVTDQLVSLGDFTPMLSTTSFMFAVGGGVQVHLAPRWAVDAGYRYSRVETDTPLHAHGVNFGLSYHF